jgi:hypothetical protein
VERYLRAIEHPEQIWLVGVQPHQQAIEGDKAGAVGAARCALRSS